MIAIENVVVRYRGSTKPALAGANLDVLPGERLALLGSSGSGKTTLLRAIAGFVPLESGRILVDGRSVDRRDARGLRALRRRVAVIAQSHDVVPALSVAHNVEAGNLGRWSTVHALRALVRLSADERAEAEGLLARVGIGGFGARRTSSLSGGERQRVAIARALAQRPRVLLADEPVASLDEDYARRILRLLCETAAEEGLTLICSLHQPALAREYFGRVLRIEDGAVREVAPESVA